MIRLGVVVASVVVGAATSFAVWWYAPPAQPRSVITTSNRASVWLKKLKTLRQLQLLRAQVSSLASVTRSKRKEGRLWNTDYCRTVEAVVPVQITYALDLDRVSWDEKTRTVTVPAVERKQVVCNFDKDEFVLWRDEGNAFSEEELLREVVDKGEQQALEKSLSLNCEVMCQKRADETVRRLVGAVAELDPETIVVRRLGESDASSKP